RPLVAKYIVGRKMVGGDEASLSSAEIRSLGEEGTGRSIEELPQSALGRAVARVRVSPVTRLPEQIYVSNKLTPEQAIRAINHEVGHVIDQLAGEIPTKGLSSELTRLYDTLNTGRERSSNFMRPQHLGYKGDEVPREYMSEAIRAY